MPYRPTAAQELLLQAALLPPEQAAAAWRGWCAEVHLENDPLDPGSYLLLAAVYANLSAEIPDFPWRARLQGVWRRAWAEAQLHTSAALPLLAALQQTGLPFLLLPGEPLHPSAVGSSPPLGKFELLVGPGHRAEALALLARYGWQPTGHPLQRLARRLLVAPTFDDFANGKQSHLRLRRRLFDLPGADAAEVGCWASATTAGLAHLDVPVLSLPDRLLYLAFAAGTWTPRPAIELIPSFVASIRAAGGEVAWGALQQRAADSPARPFAAALLAYAAQRLALPVPDSLLAALTDPPAPPAIRPFLDLHSRRVPDATAAQRMGWFVRRRRLYALVARLPGRERSR